MALCTQACFFRKQPKVFVRPPVARSEPVSFPAPDPLPLPPENIALDTPAPPDLSAAIPPLPAPPRPAAVQRPPLATAPKPAIGTQPETPAPAVPPVPRLGQILTADQAREYNRLIDESLDRVRRAMLQLEGKRLTPQQTDAVSRIRSFQKQAEQAREQDLVTAVNLARRADVLAKDLVARLP